MVLPPVGDYTKLFTMRTDMIVTKETKEKLSAYHGMPAKAHTVLIGITSRPEFRPIASNYQRVMIAGDDGLYLIGEIKQIL